jgi:hypothetical protein
MKPIDGAWVIGKTDGPQVCYSSVETVLSFINKEMDRSMPKCIEQVVTISLNPA